MRSASRTCAWPAIRASSPPRSKSAPRDGARVLCGVRGVSRTSPSATSRRRRSSVRRSRSRPPTSTARSTCCASSAPRSARRPTAREAGRSRRWSTSPARSTASSSRAARPRTSTIELGEGRMLPEFEAAVAGHDGRRDEDLRPRRSRPTTTARKWPGRRPSSRSTAKEVSRPDVPPLDERVRHRLRHQVGQGRGPSRRGRVATSGSS